MINRSSRGFAVVEILLVLLVISILVAVIVMAASSGNDTGAAGKTCRIEAREFATAVQSYHQKHEDRAWPDDHANGSMQTTMEALHASGDLSGPALKFLDGAQRVPSTSYRGWTYDFKTHTVSPLGCG